MDKLQQRRIAEISLLARKATNTSQRGFCKYLKNNHDLSISYSAIQSLESGSINKINPAYWQVLAPLAGYTYQDAIAYMNGDQIPPPTIDQVLRGIEQLPIHELAHVSKRIAERFDIEFSKSRDMQVA